MKIWMTALLSLALTACINNPQTVDEFRSAAQAGGLNVHRETVTVQQPFDTVVGRLGRFADQCLREYTFYRLLQIQLLYLLQMFL